MNDIAFRRARAADLPAIIALLADDPLGREREDVSLPPAPAYEAAFAAIDSDPNQLLAVMTEDDRVVGTLQITFIPGLSRQGALRGQIESVRIAADRRGGGLGRRVFEWAISECRSRGCSLVQLTTDQGRPDAHRFYEQLGFVASHLGFKKAL
ncbi:MAG: GNAT family N-acetyltransferase [Alphaproteobacteria bacterium]|jgi:GNAT superfamily N-acetyltransferase|nr:GNAT family N-acetyltransferase [Alphaproteobacteria bacterium]MBU2041337.1 GNAT family N-acetyltransferase [Alphaproteobacteria bacterium]MBU2125366.1 GNAT family N-acetyltransferase [Alphaproteobacteria bacterium]MBU2209528.1 GNAT family N-acetyltransferase [Alphaproteobacteria bacterium]MBU2290034.1 GNAT family N-acetyltransferase [Alphaproteobacteria bacterium]